MIADHYVGVTTHPIDFATFFDAYWPACSDILHIGTADRDLIRAALGDAWNSAVDSMLGVHLSGRERMARAFAVDKYRLDGRRKKDET